MRDPGSLDQRTGEQGSADVSEARVKVTTVSSHWRVRSMDNMHCGEPSCTGNNFPRRSRNPNHGFPKGLRVNVRRIVGRKSGYSKSLMHAPAN
jgi:hypothetical protein